MGSETLAQLVIALDTVFAISKNSVEGYLPIGYFNERCPIKSTYTNNQQIFQLRLLNDE
jgi:hypothetical protein